MLARTPSIIVLVELLMSRGMSPETSLGTAKEIDALFAISSTARGSDPGKREKWRIKKARQRSRKKIVPGGQTHLSLIEVNNSKFVDSGKKTSKSDSMSPGDVPGDKPKRSKGDVLPSDWSPTQAHYDKGRELGMSRVTVDDYGARMRNWAEANAHRQVARKAGLKGWNAAFSNWLASAAERNGGSNGKATHALGGFSGLGARLRQEIANEDAEGVAGG
jgi:hypothetical protein